LRPIVYDDSKGCDTIGVRLIRYPKHHVLKKEATSPVTDHLQWDNTTVVQDPHWLTHTNGSRQILLLNSESVRFLMENKDYCSAEAQATIDLLNKHLNCQGQPLHLCMQKQDTLDLGFNKDIQDFNILAVLTNLRKLNLQFTNPTQLEFLKGLKKLRELDIGYNNLNDENIQVMQYMPNLEELDMTSNGVTNITCLASLRMLKRLHFAGNKIHDLQPLASLKNIEYLRLTIDSPEDLSFLSSLKKLKSLNFNCQKIEDISFSALPQTIEDLSFFTTSSKGIEAITILKNLRRLTLYSLEKDFDLASLPKLAHLDELRIENNAITDITALKNFPMLTALNISENNITDIHVLQDLKNLKKLYLNSNPIEDITPLKNLKHLESVYLDQQQIEKFNARSFFQSVNPSIIVHERS
jgi:internalin A